MKPNLWLVLGALAVGAAVLGLAYGARMVRLDEGRVIAFYAARYVAETGGEVSDCVGQPGTGRTWIVVRCSGAAERVYPVSRWGRLIATEEGI